MAGPITRNSCLNDQSIVKFYFQFLAVLMTVELPIRPEARISIRVSDGSGLQLIEVVTFMEQDRSWIQVTVFEIAEKLHGPLLLRL
jgi:hypothetical protein